jgi:HTH-type transcriptional regulator/antitoxin HigA
MGPSLAGFNADWASPPGDLIEEVLEARGWTRAELAQRLDFSAKHVNELLKGRAPITADCAERLERVLGQDAGFWLLASGCGWRPTTRRIWCGCSS